MQIHHIKQHLSLSQVLKIYLLHPDKNNMLRCPFHQDKTASLHINVEKNYFNCFGCGKKGDQIEFVQQKDKLTKHEALLKCTQFIQEFTGETPIIKPIIMQEDQNKRIEFFTKMFTYFKNAVSKSQPAKDYLQSRNLDYKQLEIGYNAAQFHHGERKSQELIDQCLQYGLLLDNNLKAGNGEKAYSVFGKNGLVFPLKNQFGQIVSFYFRSTIPVIPNVISTKERTEGSAKHFYLKNRQGLYPKYPNQACKKLILTEAIIDCASLNQALTNNQKASEYETLACFGTNGLTPEHVKAIKHLPYLEEIIFFFDGDKAAQEAIPRCIVLIEENAPKRRTQVKYTQVPTPENEDINSLTISHESAILLHLIEERQVIELEDLDQVTSKYQHLREEISQQTQNPQLTTPIEFLSAKDLLKRLNEVIGQAGIVGEENSRLLLFLIIISYMNKSPIHAIVQGSSGSGKTLIISRIADLMPQEDVLRFTRITESSLYNWGEFDLFRKIIIIEDLDGLKEEALYALRELISNQFLSSSISIKDKKGNSKSARKEVKGQFSSLSATTKGETYEDNMSRSFLIAVDESKDQTIRIIHYQNQKNAGEINPEIGQKAIVFIQQLVRNLKHYEVVNPYATKLQLPEKVHKVRRLNEMYQAVIKQVTFLNQYQRAQTADRKLITTIEDIEQATEILFESIVLKVDELDGSLRQFFERLKRYCKDKNTEFTQREIRQEFNISKTQLQRFINSLLELEYIKTKGGFANKGLKYMIDYWDNYQKIRAEIKDFLLKQIEKLKDNEQNDNDDVEPTLV
jgi:DNA primase